MRRISFLLLLALGLGPLSVTVTADTLVVESVNAAATVDRPARGMTTDAVLQQFGEPLERRGPVGDPPISHWVYADFVVYFERDRVIHAVVPPAR
ncbi:MAG: hypothetical protein RQ736_08665 [Thiogranum sp.]|nr:hypothetical protein [Thiogranum sp.]